MARQVREFFVELHQGTIALSELRPEIASETTTVLFIHGHCTNKSFFSAQFDAPQLRDFHLLALDLPGYGQSPAPKNPLAVYSLPGFADVVAELIHTLDLRDLVVVGWSLGGHVGIELTLRLKLLKGLMVIGTPPIEISGRGLSQGFHAANPEVLSLFGKGNLSFAEAELFATISGYDYTAEKRFIVDAIMETDEGAKTLYPQSLLEGVGHDERQLVRDWPRPLAVLIGGQDAGINGEYVVDGVTYGNLWRNKVHKIQGAGHAAHMDRPDEVNDLIADFINDVKSSSNR